MVTLLFFTVVFLIIWQMFHRCQTPPKNECFYTHTGNLVDENHKFPGCRGTPNQYGKDSPFSHTFLDTGGILKQGWDAFRESQRYNQRGN